MPYEMEWSKHQLYVSFEGQTTPEDFDAVYEAFSGSENFDQLRDMIVDASEISSVAYTLEDVKKHSCLNYAASLSNTNIRQIIIVKSEEIEALAAYYKEFLDKTCWEIDIVASKEEAYKLIEYQ